MIALNYLAVLLLAISLIVTTLEKRFVWVGVQAVLFIANVLYILVRTR